MKSNLKEMREFRGVSQNDLFRKTGLSQQYISLLEKGKTEMTIEKAITISKALNCKVSELFNDLDAGMDKLSTFTSNPGQVLKSVREMAGVSTDKVAFLLGMNELDYKAFERIEEDTPEDKEKILRLMFVVLSAYTSSKIFEGINLSEQDKSDEDKLLQTYRSLNSVEKARLVNIVDALITPPEK